jgi:hypothetical protein
MSVFEGGADLDAIEAVCAGSGIDVFDAVAGLVDKSVLAPQEVAGRVRYRMLDTIRAYGRERLVDRGEADELTARHTGPTSSSSPARPDGRGSVLASATFSRGPWPSTPTSVRRSTRAWPRRRPTRMPS